MPAIRYRGGFIYTNNKSMMRIIKKIIKYIFTGIMIIFFFFVIKGFLEILVVSLMG